MYPTSDQSNANIRKTINPFQRPAPLGATFGRKDNAWFSKFVRCAAIVEALLLTALCMNSRLPVILVVLGQPKELPDVPFRPYKPVRRRGNFAIVMTVAICDFNHSLR